MRVREHRAEDMAGRRARKLTERIWITSEDGDYWWHSGATHGTAQGYSYWGCRCPQCRSANATMSRLWRQGH